MRNVKGIGLGTIFRNILLENDKAINFFDNFLYFPWNDVKTFIILFINNCPKGTL